LMLYLENIFDEINHFYKQLAALFTRDFYKFDEIGHMF